MFSEWTSFKSCYGCFRKLLGSGRKSRSAIMSSTGYDNACLLYWQIILRCKPEAADALLTAVPRILGAKGVQRRRDRQVEDERRSELLSQAVIKEKKGDVTMSLLLPIVFYTPDLVAASTREPAGLWAAAEQFLVVTAQRISWIKALDRFVWGIVSEDYFKKIGLIMLMLTPEELVSAIFVQGNGHNSRWEFCLQP